MRSKKLKVSIVMPNYNKESWIADSIRSVLDQTDRDFEFVIVDDGSTDGSRAVIDHFAALDTRIKKVYLKKNMGISVARNKGNAASTGDIIVIHDSDDLMLPHKIKAVRAFFNRYKLVDVFYSNYYHGRVSGEPFKMERFDEIDPYDCLYPKQLIGNITVAYRRRVWNKCKYSSKYKINDDYPFLISAWNAGFTFRHDPEPLCIMRLLSTGASFKNKNKTDKEVEKLAKTIRKYGS